MDSYYTTTFRLMSSIGIKINSAEENIFYTIVKVSSVVILILSVAQESLFILSDELLIQKICVFPCMLCVIEGLFKILTIMINRDKIKLMLGELDELHEDLNKAQKEKFREFVWTMRRFAVFFLFIGMLTVYFFNIFPIGLMLVSWFKYGKRIYLYPFFYWWPFDNIRFFLATYIYEVYCGHLTVVGLVVVDQLFMLLLAQIFGHFKQLSESFRSLVESKHQDNEVFRRELKKLVDIHIKLSRHGDVMNSVFGFTCMLRVFFGSMTICCTGFLIVVSFVSSMRFSLIKTPIIRLAPTFWCS